MICCIKGCDKVSKINGMCAAHYSRVKAGRDMTPLLRPVIRSGSDLDRLISKTEKDQASGCWTWTASLNSSGFGQMRFKGALCLAHRVSWELHFGAIPASVGTARFTKVLHTCKNKTCVNPAHLFLEDQPVE